MHKSSEELRASIGRRHSDDTLDTHWRQDVRRRATAIRWSELSGALEAPGSGCLSPEHAVGNSTPNRTRQAPFHRRVNRTLSTTVSGASALLADTYR